MSDEEALLEDAGGSANSAAEDDHKPVFEALLGGVLRTEPEVVLTSKRNIGLLAHSAAMQFTTQCLSSMMYGVLLGYLNVPGEVYATALVILGSRPFSLTVFWGILSDVFPIRGYRRKSYLAIGS